MIEIKLKEVASRLGKSMMDIARETGLNRNTITDLYHNKVDGIKFSTIDALCDTYGLSLSDVIVRTEFRIGATATAKIIREDKQMSACYAWSWLQGLHAPAPDFFDTGVNALYAFFVREEMEFYFDNRDMTRFAQSVYEQYRERDFAALREKFLRARDQLRANVDALATSPFKQMMSSELLKALVRLQELYADLFSISAWIDAFEYGVRDTLVTQVQNAHHLTSLETSLLLASSQPTTRTAERLALLDLALLYQRIHPHNNPSTMLPAFLREQRDAQAYQKLYPHDAAHLLASLAMYLSHPELLHTERETLMRLPKTHATAVKEILRAHHLRLNPLAFFVEVNWWHEEREDIDLRARMQMDQLLQTFAERVHLPVSLLPFLLPTELTKDPHAFPAEHVLRYRKENGLLISFVHGESRSFEGEQAISIQDDLASRSISHFQYDDVS